jgi:AraC family transcriptional regulator
MQATPLCTEEVLTGPFTDNAPWPRRTIMPPSTTNYAVAACPAHMVQRRAVAWNGIVAETVQATTSERLEFRFRAPLHLLAVFEQGTRVDGSTFVEGLPRSDRRDLGRKLTFVPAGHEFHEWHEPHRLLRLVYFYFDPVKLLVHSETGLRPTPLAPRLLFEDATLSDTALKLKRLVDTTNFNDNPYFEALCTVLMHELTRLMVGRPHMAPVARGGLAAWQQHLAIRYIEQHLEERISLVSLAKVVRLSPYHFCRAFKQSLGVSPQKYYNSRRIERAKALLADPATSITEVGLALGFSETSSFTRAFHKIAGLTPTAYRRALL